MWNLDKIQIKNFMSHSDSLVVFNQNETTLIYGQNLDDTEGADSNGSGKSAIIKAITKALIGSIDKKLDNEDFVRDGEKECDLCLSLSNNVLKKKLKIQRTFYRSSSKSSKIILEEEGIVNKNIVSVDDANKRILELLDIQKEDLLNYFLINQDNSHSFFLSTDTKQKEIISRFTNSKIVDDALNLVELDKEKLELEKVDLESKRQGTHIKITNLEEQILYEENEREKEFSETLDNYNKELMQEKNNLILVKNRQIVLGKEISNLQVSITNYQLQLKNYSKFNDSLKDKRVQRQKQEDELREANKVKVNLENILEGVLECPKCHYKWSLADSELNIEEYKVLLEECSSLTDSLGIGIEQLEEQISSIRKEQEKKNEIDSQISNLERKLRNFKQEKEEIVLKIETKENLVVYNQNKINEFKEFKKNSKRIQELNKQLAFEKKVLEGISMEEERLDEEIEKLNFWEINFGIAGLKTFLTNKVLSNIEGYVNFHLKKFKTNLQVKINGYKILKSGDTREKIDILVSKNGSDFNKFGRFSGGQKARVDVCGILSLQKLINLSSKSGGLNFLAVDEIFDQSFDIKGQKGVLDILEKSGITTMVISHHNNDVSVKNSLRVVYENEISRIENLN